MKCKKQDEKEIKHLPIRRDKETLKENLEANDKTIRNLIRT
jgi:hypothetical protein